MKIKSPKIILSSLLGAILVLFLGYQLYANNIYTIRTIFMQGVLVNLTPEYKISTMNILVNLKFHLAGHKIKKPQTLFKFYNKEHKEVFEIKIYETQKGIYHYNLNNQYMARPRQTDSFMKMFCSSWTGQCGITFAFSKNEPIYNLPEDISYVTIDNEATSYSTVIYDYKNIGQDIIEQGKNIKYEYDQNHVKICTKFDSFKYTEALRITTLNSNNETVQKVCTKEDTNGSCCEIRGDNSQYRQISILHWKGSWNEGKFIEYGIDLKK